MVEREHILVIVQIFIGIVGVAGNATVCLVVRKLASQGGNVNILIVYQAGIDLLASVLLILTAFTTLFPPESLPRNIIMGRLYCIFWHYSVILWSTFAMSTYNLLVITLERYIAVLHPIWYTRYFTRKTAIILIVVAWCISPIMQITFGFNHVGYSTRRECIDTPNPPSVIATQGVLLFVWEFLLPVVLMAFAFTRICIKLQQQNRRVAGVTTAMSSVRRTMTTDASAVSIVVANQSTTGSGEPAVVMVKENTDSSSVTTGPQQQQPQQQQPVKRYRNVTITLAIVFATYIICWAPAQIFFVLKNLGLDLQYQERSRLKSFAIVMGMLNSVCNPFIYALRFKQYQQAIKGLFNRR